MQPRILWMQPSCNLKHYDGFGHFKWTFLFFKTIHRWRYGFVTFNGWPHLIGIGLQLGDSVANLTLQTSQSEFPVSPPGPGFPSPVFSTCNGSLVFGAIHSEIILSSCSAPPFSQCPFSLPHPTPIHLHIPLHSERSQKILPCSWKCCKLTSTWSPALLMPPSLLYISQLS